MEETNPKIEQETEIRLATIEDIDQILALQERNLDKNLTPKEKESGGFIMMETSPELLAKIITNEGLPIARSKGKIVGYYMPMSPEQAKESGFFDKLLSSVEALEFKGKPIAQYKFAVLAQICIDKNFRGQTILPALYETLTKKLGLKYEIGIGEINDENKRSLRANIEKNGLTDIGTIEDDNGIWHIAVKELQKK